MLPLLDDCDMNMALDSVAFQSIPPAASIGGALIIDEKQRSEPANVAWVPPFPFLSRKRPC